MGQVKVHDSRASRPQRNSGNRCRSCQEIDLRLRKKVPKRRVKAKLLADPFPIGHRAKNPGDKGG